MSLPLLPSESAPPTNTKGGAAWRLRNLIEALCAFGHRGSTSKQERQAADWLSLELTGQGYSVRHQSVIAPRSYSWAIVGISLLLAFGLVVVRDGLWFGLVLTLLGSSWFHCHFNLIEHPFDWLMPKGQSQNIIAQISGSSGYAVEIADEQGVVAQTRSKGNERHNIVLMAHYDSAKSAFLYDPGRVQSFRQVFLVNAVLAYAAPLVALINLFTQSDIFSLLLAVFFAINAVLFFLREQQDVFVEGANDNASGVAAAIEAASRLGASLGADFDGRITLVLTGAEEVGAYGARNYFASEDFDQNTLVVNFDNLGKGDLHAAIGEGMLQYHPYQQRVRWLVQDMQQSGAAAAPLAYRLAYFDTLPFARAAIPCLSLIALEDGLPPNWHWPSDTVENIETQPIEAAVDYAIEFIRRWVDQKVN
jgi:hypothetical protein